MKYFKYVHAKSLRIFKAIWWFLYIVIKQIYISNYTLPLNRTSIFQTPVSSDPKIFQNYTGIFRKAIIAPWNAVEASFGTPTFLWVRSNSGDQ